MRNSTIGKVGVTLAAALAVTLMVRFGVKTGVKGHYMNDYSVYSATAATRQANADWLKRQGANLNALYGTSGALTSSTGRPILADVILRNRRAGVSSNGFPYSTSNSVVNSLNAYNAAVSDSSKFDFVISEIEPYNTGDYAGFYTTLRTVSDWCKAKGLQSATYQGWCNEACWDSISKNCQRVFIHCYKQSNAMDGASQYGYISTRLGTLAAKCKKNNVKMQVVIIYSDEPSFAYSYFQSNSFDQTYNNFLSTYSLRSTADMKAWLIPSGYMVFVSKYSKQIKP